MGCTPTLATLAVGGFGPRARSLLKIPTTRDMRPRLPPKLLCHYSLAPFPARASFNKQDASYTIFRPSAQPYANLGKFLSLLTKLLGR